MRVTQEQWNHLRSCLEMHSTQAEALKAFKRITGRSITQKHLARIVRTRTGGPPSALMAGALDIPIDWEPAEASSNHGKSGSSGIGTGSILVFKPDSHGFYVDPQAYKAFLGDIKILRPKLIVNLGDGLDAGGTFTTHKASFLKELAYSYEDDCAAQNAQLDEELKYCNDYVYIAGNHENRIERWCAQTILNKKDAQATCDLIAPDAKLKMKERGIKYIRTDETYCGLSVPGTYKIGKLHAQHGYSIAKHAAAVHLADFNECLIFGHTHRAEEVRTRTIRSDAIGCWTPGCLSLCQSYWLHSKPTKWVQGYGLAFMEPNGRFLYFNVPIINGWSGLQPLLNAIRPQHLYGSAA